ncbi:hypothetical protein BGZ60DRAFT_566782 [Tricladium varicosporioides]|nr:hypothetical protein BGZ60DRAFT_566782 [Hymenoscyphus varicosporioides]
MAISSALTVLFSTGFLSIVNATPAMITPATSLEVQDFVPPSLGTVHYTRTSVIKTTEWPTRTITVAGPGTTTLLCPLPTSTRALNCAVHGHYSNFGKSYWLAQDSNPSVCQQKCLADPRCQSFFVKDTWHDFMQPLIYDCAAYEVSVNMSAVVRNQESIWDMYMIYDRDCPELASDTCKTPEEPKVTPGPELPSSLEKRIGDSRYGTLLPTDIPGLQTYWPGYIDIACPCAIATPNPLKTVTETVPRYIYDYIYTTSTRSRTATLTAHPEWTTIVVRPT